MVKIPEKPSHSKSLEQDWLAGVIPKHIKALEYPIELARHILGIGKWTENEVKQAGEIIGKALEPRVEDKNFPGGARVSSKTPRSDLEIDQDLYDISDMKEVYHRLRRWLQHPAHVGRIKPCSDAEGFAVLVLREAVAENEVSTWRYTTVMLDILFMGFLQKQQLNAMGFLQNEEDEARFKETGRKIHKGLKEGRERSAIKRKVKRHETEKSYRELGFKLMQENPGWTLKDVAKEIRAQTGTKHAVGTIKNAIKGIKTYIHSPRTEND